MKDKKLLSLSAGLAIGLSAVLATQAQANPFKAELLKTGYDNNANGQAEKTTNGQCGAGKADDAAKKTDGTCGADMTDDAEKKADGTCGADHQKESDGTCGADMADDAVKDSADGKCSAGSCGDDTMKKATGGECADKAKDGRCGLSGDGQ